MSTLILPCPHHFFLSHSLDQGHRIKLDERKAMHGIMTLIRVDQNIVEMALVGRQVLENLMDIPYLCPCAMGR